jgi:hypothetical protein
MQLETLQLELTLFAVFQIISHIFRLIPLYFMVSLFFVVVNYQAFAFAYEQFEFLDKAKTDRLLFH